MKKIFVVLSSIMVVGCATIDSQDELPSLKLDTELKTIPTLDERCYNFAKQMRAITLLRDIGIPPNKVPTMIKPIPDVPLRPIIKEVYDHPNISADIGSKNSYDTCRHQTYPVLLEALKRADQGQLKTRKK